MGIRFPALDFETSNSNKEPLKVGFIVKRIF